MANEKRQRQRADRAARIEEAERDLARAATRRRAAAAGAVVAAALLVVGAVVWAVSGGEESPEDRDVVAGESEDAAPAEEDDPDDCVGLTEALPDGAPDFEIPAEPPPRDLRIEDLVEGDGDEVQPRDTVEVHYTGVTCSTGVVFDSSHERGAPASFSLDGVIEGWRQGIPGMRVGGVRLLTVPPALAYGDAGAGEDIGPGETLFFVVELLGTAEREEAPAVPPPPGPGASLTGETPCPPEEGATRTTAFAEPPPMCIDEDAAYVATFETEHGDVEVALDVERMPGAVNNFVVLARYGYYDDTAIFRTDPSIGIIQGGAPHDNSAGDRGPGYTIPDEGGTFDFETDAQGRGPFTYEAGQLVMARSAGPDASSAQFFFTVDDAAANLDRQGTYLVIGEVTDGLDVLEWILQLHQPDPASGLGGAPAEPVVVESVRIDER